MNVHELVQIAHRAFQRRCTHGDGHQARKASLVKKLWSRWHPSVYILKMVSCPNDARSAGRAENWQAGRFMMACYGSIERVPNLSWRPQGSQRHPKAPHGVVAVPHAGPVGRVGDAVDAMDSQTSRLVISALHQNNVHASTPIISAPQRRPSDPDASIAASYAARTGFRVCARNMLVSVGLPLQACAYCAVLPPFRSTNTWPQAPQ